MNPISACLAICVAVVGGAAFAKNTQGSTALMELAEENANLPVGAAPIAEYNRYYTYMGDRTVIGIYVRSDKLAGQRHWVSQKEMPQISGGGCSVVTVFFDPKTRKAESRCNFAQ